MKIGIKSRTIASYLSLLLLFIIVILFYAYKYISLPVAILLAAFGTGTITYLTLARLIRPLEEITHTAYEMAGGILKKEIMIQADDEIDELASSINVMARQLRKNMVMMAEERNRAKAILNSMGEGVIALDPESRVIMLNPALEEKFAVKAKNSLGKKIIEVIRNYELDQLLQEVLKSKQPKSKEIKIIKPNPVILKVHATPLITNDSSPSGVVALMRDITERRQLEKMRTDFVANVSHELRTPLTSINGFLETLLDGALEDKDTAWHFLSIMKKETDRLSRLIDDLLKLSQLENNQAAWEKHPVDMARCINQVKEMFEYQAEAKNIKLTVDIPKDLPAVLGKKDLLIQVLVNLVDNAIKYSPEKGKVKISASADEDNLIVSVSDTGPGIPQEHLPRIFERFYRVDKARSREVGGTGLGLAIVKHVLELHNGEVSVKSSPKGTTFSFILPLKKN
ncbi:MAG: phosphate regulon sensor histidine kinase PhoR [Desulfotomaculum sp.]|nr:phosphate regulon sensor histidine kinase PhoR [Desulfotomaculum sp.]